MDNQQFQSDWVGKNWIIGYSSDSSLAQGDIVQFTSQATDPLDLSQKTVQIQRTNNVTTVWATSCRIEGDELVGVRDSDGQGFRIRLDFPPEAPPRLSCRYEDTSAQRRALRAVGLSALLGALIGAAVGLAAGSPLASILAGLAAALTGSLVTASIVGAYGLRTGSGGTWVAEEGSGRGIVGPRTVHTARA
ncbi:MAG TPA: hypothetical protein VGG03_07855 [Thermoanaerobaculia bacterium]|jgi:hypothetical protein